MEKHVDILVLGGGAAGFFAAISAAQTQPGLEILLLEKSNKFLSKVKISGGGRCNVTCGEEDPKALARFYPRGGRMLSRLYYEFGPKETKDWYTRRGVKLKTESDGRVFPVTDSSQTVIECLLGELQRQKISARLSHDVVRLEKQGEYLVAHGRDGGKISAKRVIVATGGTPKEEGLMWLRELGHEIVPPLPSLFTFNAPQHPICKLMGVSVPSAHVRIAGTKLEHEGPLLITHWGVSGPAVLKLSAFAARDLAAMHYRFTGLINWTGLPQQEFSEWLNRSVKERPKRSVVNMAPAQIPSSLWKFLLHQAGVAEENMAEQIGKKQFNRLLEVCCNFSLPVNGKTTFKEEFVTTGGVSLNAIDQKTMESKSIKGVYFAGEALDIDGITGGYNFQAAWTTGHMAGKSAALSLGSENMP